MKILITGGAGFIGSNLVDHFLVKGHTVVCLDNLATGHIENLEEALKNEHFTFIQGDIRDLDTCRRAVEGVDYILHEAYLTACDISNHHEFDWDQIKYRFNQYYHCFEHLGAYAMHRVTNTMFIDEVELED